MSSVESGSFEHNTSELRVVARFFAEIHPTDPGRAVGSRSAHRPSADSSLGRSFYQHAFGQHAARRWGRTRAACTLALGTLLFGVSPAPLEPVPRSPQTTIVKRYLSALAQARYDQAYRLLNASARRYYRDAQNYASIYLADSYRVTAFSLLGVRGDDRLGRVFFARETAQFRDHAHDADLSVTATVPVGVVPESGDWRIKDPGHPWRAFAARASADANGLRVIVKKISFFARRIEAVVSFVNTGPTFVTVLPYGRSVLRDAGGRPYRLIETRDWSLTDKTLFEGLRLAPNAQYTGMLAFACAPLDDSARTFALTVSPLLIDGADAPFAISVDAIAAAAAAPIAK